MELRVFDKTVQPLGAIDELASLLWHRRKRAYKAVYGLFQHLQRSRAGRVQRI